MIHLAGWIRRRARRQPRERLRRGPACGFSLLEILVALVLLSLTFAALMRIFSSGVSNVAAAEAHARALLVAESSLASLGADSPLADGDVLTGESAGYAWTITVRRHEAAYPDLDARLPVELFRIVVEVRWEDGTTRRRLDLLTLRTAPGQDS